MAEFLNSLQYCRALSLYFLGFGKCACESRFTGVTGNTLMASAEHDMMKLVTPFKGPDWPIFPYRIITLTALHPLPLDSYCLLKLYLHEHTHIKVPLALIHLIVRHVSASILSECNHGFLSHVLRLVAARCTYTEP